MDFSPSVIGPLDFINPVNYPVDLPCQDYDELCRVSDYLSSLERDTKSFRLPNGTEVKVTYDNIGQLRLFSEDDPPHSLLALHLLGDETQVVAVFIHHKWWPISDVLKTSSKSRNGLLFVESAMERVILFLLSQIVFGLLERSLDEQIYFSSPPVSEYGKIFWQDGEAVGFYTVKKKGSLCNKYTGQSYLLPVLDTVFVRSHWRRNGLAMQMLQDFCDSMPTEKVLGISYPVSSSMYGVCKKYLEIHQEQRERLYEVEAPGNWSQRRNMWLSILVQHRPTHSTISDENSHITQAYDNQLTDSKMKVNNQQCKMISSVITPSLLKMMMYNKLNYRGKSMNVQSQIIHNCFAIIDLFNLCNRL
ncbi:protein FAM169B isoform X1 [Clarias gariepinus]|uniref:protein FAM169B isoform X1 n=1 Tax=Clarias gariepinus TaxID=13013 RepID=UPI00234CB23A|nr:protein FAM169B isoform X1 [Clarias gariepinus]